MNFHGSYLCLVLLNAIHPLLSLPLEYAAIRFSLMFLFPVLKLCSFLIIIFSAEQKCEESV